MQPSSFLTVLPFRAFRTSGFFRTRLSFISTHSRSLACHASDVLSVMTIMLQHLIPIWWQARKNELEIKRAA